MAALLCALMSSLLVLTACGADTSTNDGMDTVALPADFPRDAVPLLDGTVLAATGTAKDGWSITVQGKPDAGNALDAAVAKLTDAGFTESSRTNEGGQRAVMASKKTDGTTYWVSVGSSRQAAGGPNSVFYQVNAE